jgi:hypothetical protein
VLGALRGALCARGVLCGRGELCALGALGCALGALGCALGALGCALGALGCALGALGCALGALCGLEPLSALGALRGADALGRSGALGLELGARTLDGRSAAGALRGLGCRIASLGRATSLGRELGVRVAEGSRVALGARVAPGAVRVPLGRDVAARSPPVARSDGRAVAPAAGEPVRLVVAGCRVAEGALVADVPRSAAGGTREIAGRAPSLVVEGREAAATGVAVGVAEVRRVAVLTLVAPGFSL